MSEVKKSEKVGFGEGLKDNPIDENIEVVNTPDIDVPIQKEDIKIDVESEQKKKKEDDVKKNLSQKQKRASSGQERYLVSFFDETITWIINKAILRKCPVSSHFKLEDVKSTKFGANLKRVFDLYAPKIPSSNPIFGLAMSGLMLGVSVLTIRAAYDPIAWKKKPLKQGNEVKTDDVAKPAENGLYANYANSGMEMKKDEPKKDSGKSGETNRLNKFKSPLCNTGENSYSKLRFP